MKKSMNCRNIFILIVTLWVMINSNPTFAYIYQVVELGTLGGERSWAASINDYGQIVGWSDDNTGNGRATLFDATGMGNNIDLGTLGGNGSNASSINNLGYIVGSASNFSTMNATMFEATGGGNNLDLKSPGDVLSINNNNQMVGYSDNYRATIFDNSGAGNNIYLGTLGGIESAAQSINDSGKIIGWSENSLRQIRATLFDASGNGNNIELGTLGGLESRAYSINNLNQIVGMADDIFGKGIATFFDSTGLGNNTSLGDLGGERSEALSINNLGHIVGWSYNSLGDPRAVLFDPTGGDDNIDLNTLIDPESGWILRAAYNINDNDLIVGWGHKIDDLENPRAFLLVPEPSSLICLSLGGLVLRRRKRNSQS